MYQQRLDSGREGAAEPAVWILPFDLGDGEKPNVDAYRQLEGRVLARYLRWLVESSGVEIVDPLDGRPRRIRYGDMAILAVSTWGLSLLFPWLDAECIPYASRGGKLFLEDPLHRQFLLALRALADRDDGVAEAALLRPPFFVVDLADLLRERAQSQDERAVRGHEARELVRELCLVFEQIAADDGLDYDSVSARMREWVGRPIQLAPGRSGSRRGDDGSPGKRARIPGGCDLGREGPVEHSPGERRLADGACRLRLDASTWTASPGRSRLASASAKPSALTSTGKGVASFTSPPGGPVTCLSCRRRGTSRPDGSCAGTCWRAPRND